jgi:hypothetical protein
MSNAEDNTLSALQKEGYIETKNGILRLGGTDNSGGLGWVQKQTIGNFSTEIGSNPKTLQLHFGR